MILYKSKDQWKQYFLESLTKGQWLGAEQIYYVVESITIMKICMNILFQNFLNFLESKLKSFIIMFLNRYTNIFPKIKSKIKCNDVNYLM